MTWSSERRSSDDDDVAANRRAVSSSRNMEREEDERERTGLSVERDAAHHDVSSLTSLLVEEVGAETAQLAGLNVAASEGSQTASSCD